MNSYVKFQNNRELIKTDTKNAIARPCHRLSKEILNRLRVSKTCNLIGAVKRFETKSGYRGKWNKSYHDDDIKWKQFPRYWPFVRGIHRPPVYSPHKDQWHGDLVFSLISAWTHGWVNNRDAGDLRRCRAHYDGTVTSWFFNFSF